VILPKSKRIRLKGKQLAELNRKIHERDNYSCIACGAYVDEGEKFHHEYGGKDKEDIEEKGVTLCYRCHHERHFGKLCTVIKEKCREYLRNKYPEYYFEMS
jgi:hypothetical protein